MTPELEIHRVPTLPFQVDEKQRHNLHLEALHEMANSHESSNIRLYLGREVALLVVPQHLSRKYAPQDLARDASVWLRTTPTTAEFQIRKVSLLAPEEIIQAAIERRSPREVAV